MPQLNTSSATSSSEQAPLLTNGRTLNGIGYALESLKDIYDVRLDGMDKAISVAHEDLVRVPTEVDKAIAALKDVIDEKFATVDEKFASVQKQFIERDTRVTEKAELTQTALDAALLTAEKAVGKQSEAFAASTAKSEASATKQIDAIGVQLSSVEKTSNDKHAATQAQITRLDNTLTAFISQNSGRVGAATDLWARLVGAAIVGGGLIGLIQFLVARGH